jgi:mRNA-degrading endonuclease RelE of RelBE toxin-antitoxin system
MELFLTPAAEREYGKLPQRAREQIGAAFDGPFSRDPLARELDVKKLSKPLNGYRLRLGDYRVLFRIEPGFIIVYSIRNRKDAYR